MTSWHNLYLSCVNSDVVVPALEESLTSLGYELYNPFSIMPGISYPQAVRLFIAPYAAGWQRVVGAPDSRQLPALSRLGLCLYAALDGTEAKIEVYREGEEVEAESALVDYLRGGKSADDLARVFSESSFDLPPVGESVQTGKGIMAVPVDALPDDVREMAQQVDMKKADKMFKRLSGKLVGTSADADAAKAIIGASGQDWNSVGGQRIRALMACLSVPESWREPDFVTLREAYQLHIRRERRPDARLLPGDAEAMAAVPDALDYVPVYGGMNN